MNQFGGLLAVSWVELGAGLLFLVFWLISAAVGQVAKRKEEEERRRMRERLEREGAIAPVPSELPPVLPRELEVEPAKRGTVTTREEMERRMREALARREASAQRERGRFRETQSDPDVRERQPVQADGGGVFEDPFAEARRRTEEERVRREAAHREQEKRRQVEERDRKKAEQYRKAEKARLERERLEREAMRAEQNEPHTAAPHRSVHRVVANDPVQLAERSPSSGQRPAALSAQQLRAVLTPQTLRQQYILTELLAPPVALRGEREI